MNKVAVVSAVRSPVGKIPGELNYLSDTELLSKVFKETVLGYEDIIDEAIVGSGFPVERDNLCRKALLEANLPEDIICSTISKTCASSDEAINIAYSKIKCGKAKTILVGGCEKISNSPYTLHFMKKNVKNSVKKNIPYYDEIKDNILENDMVYISEMLSRRHNITRKEQDDFAYKSIKKAINANNAGLFYDELLSIEYKKENQTYTIYADELLQIERLPEVIYKASSMFLKDGTLTQYNAATMCDCAAGMLLMDYEEAKKRNILPLATILDVAETGVTKDKTGYAMSECINKILEDNKLSINNIDLFEINESFAAQALVIINILGLDLNKVNVNGGNLALGYPIGATGIRMNISLIYEMRRRKSKLGLSAMCAGGNMSNAVIFTNSQGNMK